METHVAKEDKLMMGAKIVANAISKHKNGQAYYVGGAERDRIMGIIPHDIDLATNLSTSDIKAALKAANIPYTIVGEKYGTIVALANVFNETYEYEVTTFRQDLSYEDGRHPVTRQASSIEEDLSRRDFTMNAMARDCFTSEIIDPFGGVEDINNRLLRFVGDPDERIKEDGLRIVRAVRFAIKYGFNLSVATKEAIHRNIDMLDKVSNERKTEELRKMLTCGKDIAPVFREFPDVLFKLIPDLKDTYGCSQVNKYHHTDVFNHILNTTDLLKSDDFVTKLAALFHDTGKVAAKVTDETGYDRFKGHSEISFEIAKRASDPSGYLKLTSKEKDKFEFLVLNHDINFFVTEKSFNKAILKYGEDYLVSLRLLSNADFSDHVIPDCITKEKLEAWHTNDSIVKGYFDSLKNKPMSLKELNIDGNELINLGYKPGPKMGEILKEMLAYVVDGTLKNEKGDLERYAKDKLASLEENKESSYAEER